VLNFVAQAKNIKSGKGPDSIVLFIKSDPVKTTAVSALM
jgi:hypothetical protein